MVAAERVVVVDWLQVAVVPVEMEDWMVVVGAVPVGLVVGSTVVVGGVPMEMLLVVGE